MKRLTKAPDAAFKGNPSSLGADAALPNCAQKKSGSKGQASRRKISLFKRMSVYMWRGVSSHRKARNSAISERPQHGCKACFGHQKAAKKARSSRSPAALTGHRPNGNAQPLVTP
ncbi:hypothetical protein LB565_12500 [Mesorhizobium sp. CA14]|uniref:hypothetical protein n=1 Tax=Mesorhizobium sp. CA14 TaxID=2876642 RepID=UPI001CCB734A|nr:hypothetical protein [Mesorhizobium sp. CA14]MBZ9848801.1 hypothetical protein [Mesorhizobium sp. CA14]